MDPPPRKKRAGAHPVERLKVFSRKSVGLSSLRSSSQARGEPAPRLKVARAQEDVDVGEGGLHPNRRRLELWLPGVRVDPDETVRPTAEALQFSSQDIRLAEVPTVAQDHQGRPTVDQRPESAVELLQGASDPRPAARRSEGPPH